MFESFTLSENIAGDCNIIIETQSAGSCGYTTGGESIFLEGITGCVDTQVPIDFDGLYNGMCYHVPTETSDLFNS